MLQNKPTGREFPCIIKYTKNKVPQNELNNLRTIYIFRENVETLLMYIN